MNPSFADVLRHARSNAGLSQRDLAARLPADQSRVSRWESGKSVPDDPGVVSRLDVLVRADGALRRAHAAHSRAQPRAELPDDIDALELARRVAASDLGGQTLTHLEAAFDGLATEYPSAVPGALLPRLSEHLGYVGSLLDCRATPAERQRLHTSGAWLSLLTATVHIDLNQDRPASAWLRTATELAQHAEHHEILAWCWETEAWRALGRSPRRARELARAAQHRAPAGSSAAIQATAQEGRAAARVDDIDGTHRSLEHLQAMCAGLEKPDPAEHHYRYDPGKAGSYTATTLAWLGDPEAERHARDAITRFTPGDRDPWPRRYASAHIDLALISSKNGDPEEACSSARTAMLTGRLAPSEHWRAREVLDAVVARGFPGAAELRETYEAMIRG